MTAFDPTDAATWPAVLSIDEVAAIYRTTPNAIQHSLKPSSHSVPFSPRPAWSRPMRWRKVDVERDVIGQRSVEQSRIRVKVSA